MIQRMLAIWSLVPLSFLNPAWTSGSPWFTYYWSLVWRILSITLLWCAAAAAKSLQSCPTLCDPTDSSPSGSSVHGIFQARVLEWVAIAFSKYIYAFELWCWRRLLRVPWIAVRSNQSFLKVISPEYSSERLMLKLKLQYSGHLMWGADSFEKTDAGKDWRWEEKGTTEDELVGWHHGFNGCGFE